MLRLVKDNDEYTFHDDNNLIVIKHNNKVISSKKYIGTFGRNITIKHAQELANDLVINKAYQIIL